jgi:hypothetical protein
MAYIVMAYVIMAYEVMAYTVMAYVVMAYVVMAYVVMAYVVMARYSCGPIYLWHPLAGTKESAVGTIDYVVNGISFAEFSFPSTRCHNYIGP